VIAGLTAGATVNMSHCSDWSKVHALRPQDQQAMPGQVKANVPLTSAQEAGGTQTKATGVFIIKLQIPIEGSGPCMIYDQGRSFTVMGSEAWAEHGAVSQLVRESPGKNKAYLSARWADNVLEICGDNVLPAQAW
jgi:hypothetical protein